MATRSAVLIDGDNIGAQHVARIRDVASAFGTPDVWRVYADASMRKDWLDVPGIRLIHAGAGKNAAEVLLSIDAMEMALRDGIDGFVIVTSDGDFSHISSRLREGGRRVIGVGEAKTPPVFRAACTSFETIGVACKSPLVTELDRRIRSMIAQHSQKGEGMRIAELAPKMHASYGLRISSLPDKRWRSYLTKRSTLYAVDPKGPEARVRFKRAGFET